MIGVVFAFALAFAAGLAQAAPAGLTCPPPVETDGSPETLPHLAASLKPGASIDILAIGNAASALDAATKRQQADGFFAQISQALTGGARLTNATVTLLGGRELDAPAQLQLIRGALQRHHYQLVIWVTGTVDAVQDEPAEDFYQTLADGADLIAGASADLVLVEPQYSRFLEANANLGPYLSAMQAVSASAGALLFHRYGLMHDWEDAGLIDLEHAAAGNRHAVSATLHACLGAELGRALLAAAMNAGGASR